MYEDVLKCGSRSSSDNALVINCNNDLLNSARQLLQNDSSDCKSIVVDLNNNTLSRLFNYLNSKNLNYFQTSLVINGYINSSIMLNLMDKFNFDVTRLGQSKDELLSYFKTFESINGKFNNAYDHSKSSIPYDIESVVKDYGKFDLSFIINNVSNRLIYQVVNNFLASREPYCVKVFADGDLLSYCDLNGNLVQSPHDYQKINANKLIYPK